MQIRTLYKTRFSIPENISRDRLWKVLCKEFIQRYVSQTDTVLDLGAGYCNFINNISANKKIAVDLNPDTSLLANDDVIVYKGSCTRLPASLTDSVDVVFAGCLLEHLPSKEEILKTFKEVKRVLRSGGKFIILNPNIRFSISDFWDYFDHVTPVSDRSVVEGLQLAGFNIHEVIPRFVPNTIKDRLPKSAFLVKLYLHMPFLFPIFGKQMFIVAKKG